MRIPPGVRSRLKTPTASLCAIAGLVIAWPSGLFPGNMIPIPAAVASIGDSVVTKLVSKGSLYLLETAGFFFPMNDGRLLITESMVIDISVASGGLRILLAVLALATAAAALSSKPVWERLLIVASGFPIAIVCGVIRVSAGCFLHTGVSDWLGGLLLFEVAGWLTLSLAWGLLQAERALLSRLLITPPAREVVPVFCGVEQSAARMKPAEIVDEQRRTVECETAQVRPDRERSQPASTQPFMRQGKLLHGSTP